MFSCTWSVILIWFIIRACNPCSWSWLSCFLWVRDLRLAVQIWIISYKIYRLGDCLLILQQFNHQSQWIKLCPECLEMDPNSGKSSKVQLQWQEHAIIFWLSYHRKAWTNSRYWQISCVLQSYNTLRRALTIEQL